MLILIYNGRYFKREYFKDKWDSKHVKYDELKEGTAEVIPETSIEASLCRPFGVCLSASRDNWGKNHPIRLKFSLYIELKCIVFG